MAPLRGFPLLEKHFAPWPPWVVSHGNMAVIPTCVVLLSSTGAAATSWGRLLALFSVFETP